MTEKDLTFKRKERKYIILEHTFDEIQQELKDHLPLYIHTGKEPVSHIDTIYLDTKDHVLFQEYLRKRNFRFKIRLRRYGQKGQFEEKFLVELKVKHNGISSKKRFMLPVEYLDNFIKGEDLISVIKEVNTGFTGAQKTYKLINQLIQINNFVPILKTGYQRVAFQKSSRRVRITVDRNIKHQKLQGKEAESSLDAVLLESKIMGKTPKWYKKMVNQLSLLRQKRFSKYATGMNALYYNGRGKYNFYADDLNEIPIPEKLKISFEHMKDYLKLEETL